MGISLDHCSCFNVLLVSIRYRFLAITLTWLLTCDGTRVDISEEKFLKYFWWCWNKLQVHVQLYSFPYGGATLCWMNRSTMKQIYLVSSCCFHCKNWWMMRQMGLSSGEDWWWYSHATLFQVHRFASIQDIFCWAGKIDSKHSILLPHYLFLVVIAYISCHVGLSHTVYSSLVLLA
jgi:hypothetical protein